MACSKYNLTNTGSTTINFNYQRCDDTLWQYQVELLPGQTKNIWLVNGTYSSAQLFQQSIVLVDEGVFPPLQITPTPSVTPTATPTPSVTATVTPTPSVTASVTPTVTPTITVTPTNSRNSFAVTSGTTAEIACQGINSTTIWGEEPSFDANSQFFNASSGPVTIDMTGFYSDGSDVIQVDSSGTTVGFFTICNTPTPTPTNTQTPTVTSTVTPTVSVTPSITPTQTQTPTPSIGYYTYVLGTGTTTNDACNNFNVAPQTLFGTLAGGVGPNIGETLYLDSNLSVPATDGYYSNGTALYQISGGAGLITAVEPDGCVGIVTPTPTVTSTVTPTTTATPTVTPTMTQTPTPTNIVRTTLAGVCHSETSASEACECLGTATIYVNGTSLADSTLAWADQFGPNTGDPTGWYVQDNIVYFLNGGCGIGCITGATITVDSNCPTTTPTPTPTVTPTPTITVTPTTTSTPTPTVTPTNARFEFVTTFASSAIDACHDGSVVTIWGDESNFDQNTLFYDAATGPVTTDMSGYYSYGGVVTQVDTDGSQLGAFSLCASPTPTPTVTPTASVTPTVTPTLTPTPTQTIGYFTYILGYDITTASLACANYTGGTTQEFYSSLSSGPGPNIGEFLFLDEALTLPATYGFYSNGVAWFEITGSAGEITSSDPNGCS